MRRTRLALGRLDTCGELVRAALARYTQGARLTRPPVRLGGVVCAYARQGLVQDGLAVGVAVVGVRVRGAPARSRYIGTCSHRAVEPDGRRARLVDAHQRHRHALRGAERGHPRPVE